MKQVKEKYQEFIEVCIRSLRQQLGEGYNIQVNTILKNNSMELNGVIILKDGAKISPNIYLEDYYALYENGESMESITDAILNVYHDKVCEKSDFDIQFTFETMKENIIFRLVNREKNKVLLMNCPHIDFMDLAMTFHCLVQEREESIGTIRITNEHMKLWKVETKEIYELALKNTPRLLPPLLRRMEDVLRDILSREGVQVDQEDINMELLHLEVDTEDEEYEQMYILSNVKGINGASCILYPQVIRNFAKLLKCDVYILPSSIHEVILLPAKSYYYKQQLEEMVADINRTQVPYEEVLSDHVYFYSSVEDQIKELE